MESDQEAYFQDDNINNFHDDDSDEELFEDDTNNVSKIIEDLEKDENGKDEVEPEPEKNTNGTSTEKSIGIKQMAQSFTSLMADLHQDIPEVLNLEVALNGTFP